MKAESLGEAKQRHQAVEEAQEPLQGEEAQLPEPNRKARRAQRSLERQELKKLAKIIVRHNHRRLQASCASGLAQNPEMQ